MEVEPTSNPRLKLASRRQVLARFGAGGLLLLGTRCGLAQPQASPTLPGCIVRPEQIEGPFFIDETLDRSDIRSDPSTGVVKPGLPLRVSFRVSRIAERCEPLVDARVDLWQCDAAGAYSGVHDAFGSTAGQKFLRGYQLTDRNGRVTFTTIYPGWYRGRAVHLHFKIRTRESRTRGYEFTSQIYFDDAVTDRVLGQPPYAARGRRDRYNEQDGLFLRGGRQLMLALNQSERGYEGTFDIGLRFA